MSKQPNIHGGYDVCESCGTDEGPIDYYPVDDSAAALLHVDADVDSGVRLCDGCIRSLETELHPDQIKADLQRYGHIAAWR